MVHSFYSSDQPSGENTVVLNEVDALRRAGHTVELFAAHTDELEGEVFYKLRAGLRVATGYGRNPLKAIRDFSPDVVHVHNLFPNFGSRWIGHCKVPIVHTVHNFRPLCAAATLYRDGGICTLCIDQTPLQSLQYRCYKNSVLATLPLAASKTFTNKYSVLQQARHVLFLSETSRRLYHRAGFSGTSSVWPNFLPDEYHSLVTDSKPEERWLYVGRLTEEKGILQLLDIWPENIKLSILGSGPARDDVRDAAKTKDVELHGRVSRADVASALSRSAGLVFPSRWFELFPLTYLEALVNGSPILALDTNVVAELVSTDATGHVASWNESIRPHLNALWKERGNYSTHNRNVFNRKYSEASHVSRAVSLYETLSR